MGYVEDILQWGLDERVCSMEGLYGAGVYFASDVCKAGQYARPAGDTRYLFYTRVLLGHAFHPKSDTKGQRRPPAFNKVSGKLFDSVVANVKEANEGRQIHREFVIYDRRQTYPEFQIELK